MRCGCCCHRWCRSWCCSYYCDYDSLLLDVAVIVVIVGVVPVVVILTYFIVIMIHCCWYAFLFDCCNQSGKMLGHQQATIMNTCTVTVPNTLFWWLWATVTEYGWPPDKVHWGMLKHAIEYSDIKWECMSSDHCHGVMGWSPRDIMTSNSMLHSLESHAIGMGHNQLYTIYYKLGGWRSKIMFTTGFWSGPTATLQPEQVFLN